jgi:DNA-binding NarL/FixJ family response regulator
LAGNIDRLKPRLHFPRHAKAIITQQMVLALISDLFFVSRVQSASQAAGLRFESLDSYKTVAEFLDLLHQRKPALIVLDLNSALPWPEWLPAVKADRLTRDIPWLAFGSHMNPRRLAAARHAGADKVVPKSEFAVRLNEMIKLLTTDKHR